MPSDRDGHDARVPARAHRATWRWHAWLGLLAAPVMLVLAITGALYLYDTEIERAWYGPLMNVTPGPRPAPPDVLEAAVHKAYPQATLASVAWPHDATHVATWTVADPQAGRLNVFVDPWTARVLGALPEDGRLMRVIVRLHGELLAGRVGDGVVEAAASAGLVLAVSGLALWWPKRWRLRAVFVPRLRARGRAFWRDLHAVPSALLAAALALLVLSGLPWSGLWGERLAALGTLSAATMPTPNFRDPPKLDEDASASPHPGHAAHHAKPAHETADVAKLPWTIRHSVAPQLDAGADGTRIPLSSVMAIAAARGLADVGPNLRVFYPDGPRGVYTISLVPSRAEGQRTVYLDPRDGRVIDDIGWSRYSPLGKAVEWGVEVHVGREYGEPNRLIALLVCLGLAVTSCAALVLWWTRRAPGTLGLPDAKGGRLPRWLLATLVACGLLFPLLGVLLLVLAVADRQRSGRTRA